jgi:hypothetical protein
MVCTARTMLSWRLHSLGEKQSSPVESRGDDDVGGKC